MLPPSCPLWAFVIYSLFFGGCLTHPLQFFHSRLAGGGGKGRQQRQGGQGSSGHQALLWPGLFSGSTLTGSRAKGKGASSLNPGFPHTHTQLCFLGFKGYSRAREREPELPPEVKRREPWHLHPILVLKSTTVQGREVGRAQVHLPELKFPLPRSLMHLKAA